MKATDFLITIYERETAYSVFTYINTGIDSLNALAGADSEIQPLMRSDEMIDALKSKRDVQTFCVADDSEDGRDLIDALDAKGFKPDAILSVRATELQTHLCNYVCYLLK